MYLEDKVSHLIKEKKNERAIAILNENPTLLESDKLSFFSFLHYCAVYDNVNMAHYLLDNGCHIDIQDQSGKTPLMLAVQTGRRRVAEALLSAGADFDEILSYSDKSVLHITFDRHLVSAEFLVQLLTKLQNKCTTNEEAAQKLIDTGCHLYQAVCSKNYKIIEYMLNREHSINFVHPIERLSALHFAVYYEQFKMVKLLLKHGASVSALDIQGRAPLFYLYYRNPKHSIEKLNILKLMLDSGTLIMLPRPMCAIFQIVNILMRGNHEAVRLVLQSYPNHTDEEKCSKKIMLLYLARNINSGIVEELELHIEEFDVNAVDKRGRNPLYWAFKARNVTMVQYLLEKGTTVKKLNSNLKTGRLIKLLEQNENADEFVPGRSTRKKIRIFDSADVDKKKNNLKEIKFIIAHLAMLKQLGISITKKVWSKIKSLPQWKKYFKKCWRLLQTEITGKVTILKLLTGDEEKVAFYLNRKKLGLKLERISYKRKLKSTFPYYFNVIRERIFEGCLFKTLKDNALFVFGKIADYRLTTNTLISNKIMYYLDYRDLLNLYRAYA